MPADAFLAALLAETILELACARGERDSAVLLTRAAIRAAIERPRELQLALEAMTRNRDHWRDRYRALSRDEAA